MKFAKRVSRLRMITPALVLALSATMGVAPSPSVEGVIDSFPIRHITITDNSKAPDNTVWVTVDDRTASGLNSAHSKAIPLDGAVREVGYGKGPKSDECAEARKYDQPCWTSWVYVTANQEARAFAWWRGQSCVLIGSREPGTGTRINCEGIESKLTGREGQE